MTIEEFGEAIGLTPEAIEAAARHSFDREECKIAICSDSALEYDEEELLSLVMHSALLLSLPEYQRRGIAEGVFIDTFSDITRWEAVWSAQSGRPGLERGRIFWLRNHLRLELFALGSLQYQKRKRGDELEIHIPKGADISSSAVDESLKCALEFFHLPRCTFFCSSWLLAPELSSLLDEESRILAFCRRFTIISSDYTSRQAEERIFPHIMESPDDYPESTSLQRRAKAFLKGGGKIPKSTGCFTLCE